MIILIGLAVAAVIILYLAHLIWLVFLGLVIVAAAAIAWLMRESRHNGGLFWTTFLPPVWLRRVKCTECGGRGALWLEPSSSRWKIIPKRYLMVSDAAPFIQPPLANTQQCPCCRGRGFHFRQAVVPARTGPPGLVDLAQLRPEPDSRPFRPPAWGDEDEGLEPQES